MRLTRHFMPFTLSLDSIETSRFVEALNDFGSGLNDLDIVQQLNDAEIIDTLKASNQVVLCGSQPGKRTLVRTTPSITLDILDERQYITLASDLSKIIERLDSTHKAVPTTRRIVAEPAKEKPKNKPLELVRMMHSKMAATNALPRNED